MAIGNHVSVFDENVMYFYIFYCADEVIGYI